MVTLLLALVSLAVDDRVQVVDPDPAAKQPQVAVDGQGHIYVAYGADNEIRCVTSADGGKSFSEPVVVARVSKLALGMRRGPRIAVTNDAAIIAAVVGGGESGQAGNVVAWRSTDGGKTWSEGTMLNMAADSAREGLHALAARPDGVVLCVWLDLSEGAMTIHGAASGNSGELWQPAARVAKSPAKEICTCCHPSLAFGSGPPALMWRDDIDGARDMYLGRWQGKAGEVAPSKVEKLGKGTWILDRCPMDGGAIAFDAAGKLTTVWMRAERVYTSDRDGVEELVGPGVQPWAAGGKQGAHLVWLQKRPGKLMYRAAGESLVQELAKAAIDPVIASGPRGQGPVAVAWERAGDERGVAVKTLSGTGE